MDKDTLKKSLEKYTKHALKVLVDYEIHIAVRDTLLGWSTYTVTYIFTIDHSKFWRGNRNNPNPNFSQEYNDEVNKIYMDEYTEELETSVKLFGISEPDIRIEYKSINKEIYDPLIKSLNNDYYGDFKPEFLYGSPALGLEFVYFVDVSVVQIQLDDEGFDTEDIAFYN